MYEKKDCGYYINRHSCFLLSYHVVLVTKYRRPVLDGNVRILVYSIIREVLKERGCILKELNGEPDHVHIFFDAGPELQLLTWCGSSKQRPHGLPGSITPGSWNSITGNQSSGRTATLPQPLAAPPVTWWSSTSGNRGRNERKGPEPQAFTHAHAGYPMGVVLCLI